ncbi:ATP-binding cassette domain-containing protein [Microbacterium sp.]|uniref:ATP-binding cassette domain-containing protein n=1 Tax=Microbacterium sp. TaxID=51671 RepID=UPI0039E3692E
MPVPSVPDVALRCADLSVARRGDRHRVIDGVTVTLPQGGALAVMGPTGAGKSSLLAVLAGAGELTVVGGEAWVDGIRVRDGRRARRTLGAVTGYLPQGAGGLLAARLTVAETIAEPVTSRERRRDLRALAIETATLLDELRLPLGATGKYPYELSSGMRQRVALARALITRPRVLLCDDPYVNLDTEARESACAAIARRLTEHGTAVVVATHEERTAMELDADVLVLRAGFPVACGRVGALQWTPGEAERAAS